MEHTIRTIRMEDAAAVSRLLNWAWFAPRSEAGWRWLCRTPRSRPAREIPVGWVVEDGDGRIGGVVGVFAQDYVVEGEAVVGATGHTLIVEPRMRGAASRLLRRYADIDGVFGVFHLNANARSAPLCERFGFTGWPPDHADVKLVWPTDPLAILAERALQLASGGRRPGTDRFLRDRLFTPDLVRLDPGVEQVFARDIDARFDAFWGALAAEGRLTARRDAAALRWRMADPDRTLDPLLLTWMEDGHIAGYALAQIVKINELTAPDLEIIDLVALKHCAERAMPALVASLVRNAPRLGVARVRLSVVTQEMERRLAGLPGALRIRRHAHGHARLSEAGLALASRWRLTPYDGDHGFCLRSPPRPEAGRVAA